MFKNCNSGFDVLTLYLEISAKLLACRVEMYWSDVQTKDDIYRCLSRWYIYTMLYIYNGMKILWAFWVHVVYLKGTVSRDFLLLVFWFFSWISFPQAPEYTVRAVSNFVENSRRYSQLKVHHRCHWHRWQMEKIFNHKSFNNLVWTPLGSRVNIFAFMFTLRSQQPDIGPIICHWWQICRRCCWYR